MKVWITGAQGMLGQDMMRVCEQQGHEVTGTDRAQVDITNEQAVLDFAQEHTFDVIINTAAYNLVDRAEDEDGYKMALAVNVEGPRYLARATKNIGARFVHYSTDYVFSGTKRAPYTETDIPDPISKYGTSKALGEQAVRESCDQSFIIRVSKLFGAQGSSATAKRSFVDLMLEKAHVGDSLNVIDGEAGCPTYTPHLAQATLDMLVNNVASGIYHLVNAGGGVAWYAFAKEIFEIAGLSPNITPVSSDFFPRKAKRPSSVVLENTKLPSLPHRLDALREYIGKK